MQYYAVTRLNAQDHVDRYVKVRDDLRGNDGRVADLPGIQQCR